jgi:glutathione S-transferase
MRHQDYVDKAKLSPARIFKSPMEVSKRTTPGRPRSWPYCRRGRPLNKRFCAPKTKAWVEGSTRIFTRSKLPSITSGVLIRRQKLNLRNASMSDLIVYGFPRSTFVNIVRLVLTHKEVAYTFHDLEPEMGKPTHLALHPFNRVPILRHGDFTVYETSAIVSYLEESFPKPALQPKSVRDRARVNQWISAVNSYYYPYMIYHVSHERNVFPELGIRSDENVVAHALPKIEVALKVAERELAHGKDYLLGSAKRRRAGTTSRKSSSRLPPRSLDRFEMPVTLPPGLPTFKFAEPGV